MSPAGRQCVNQVLINANHGTSDTEKSLPDVPWYYDGVSWMLRPKN